MDATAETPVTQSHLPTYVLVTLLVFVATAGAVHAADTLGFDHLIGSIEPGTFADFTVLEQAPYKVARENPSDIPVWGTVVGGQVTRVSEIPRR